MLKYCPFFGMQLDQVNQTVSPEPSKEHRQVKSFNFLAVELLLWLQYKIEAPSTSLVRHKS